MAAGEARLSDCLKLPHLAEASIRTEKLSGYLLSPTHPAGRHKARFFEQFGFTASDVETLRSALLAHAASTEVSSVGDSSFGKRYAVDGALTSPDGRNPRVGVIWFIEAGATEPRFVTAYPLAKETE